MTNEYGSNSLSGKFLGGLCILAFIFCVKFFLLNSSNSSIIKVLTNSRTEERERVKPKVEDEETCEHKNVSVEYVNPVFREGQKTTFTEYVKCNDCGLKFSRQKQIKGQN